MRHSKFWLLAAILAGLLLAAPAWADPVTRIKLKIVNNSGYADNQIYLIVWGYTWADPTTTEGHTPHHLDLKTGNYPACLTDDNTVSVTGSPDKYCNYWVTLDQIKQPDGSYSFSFPEINSARLVISFQRPAYFHINPAEPPPSLVTWVTMREPDYKNTTDPSYKTIMDKFEFSYDTAHKLYANTTNVDYTCLSLMFEMLDKDSHSLGKGGFPCSQAALYQGLLANPELRKMSTPYRFFSPSILKPGQMDPTYFPPISFPDNYWKPYVDYVWSTYWQGKDSLVITEPGFTATGQISGDVLTLTTNRTLSQEIKITKPTIDWDIFAGAGVFQSQGGDQGVLVDEICSALNRTVMHLPFNQWGKGNKDNYYKQNGLPADKYRTNTYSQALHFIAIGGLVYGYSWDDKYDQQSGIASQNPDQATELVVTINESIKPSLAYLSLLLLD